MIKPCIGYDFCLSHIHIHGRLSGRMYKIVAPTLTAAASAAAAVSVPPATPSEVCVCVCACIRACGFFPHLNGVDEASRVLVNCSSHAGDPHRCGQQMSGCKRFCRHAEVFLGKKISIFKVFVLFSQVVVSS